MNLNDLVVEVRDVNLVRRGQIEPEYLDIRLEPVHLAPGAWTVRLPAEHRMVPYLRQPGAGIIVTHTDPRITEPLLSGPSLEPTDEASVADPEGMVTFTGTSDEVILWQRLAYPQPTTDDLTKQDQAYDVRSGTAEAVMIQYMRWNVGDLAPTSRRIPGLTYPPNQGRGGPATRSARFDVLGDLLADIATVAGLGFRVVQIGDHLEFRVTQPIDRSGLVRMDVWNGTLASHAATKSAPTATRVVVAGQGEGVLRTLVEVATTTPGDETDWGIFGRREVFKDQRNTDELLELQQAGQKVLLEGAATASVKVVPGDDTTMDYPLSWGLGDVVGLVVGEQEVSSTVTGAFILANREVGVRVGASIGDVDGWDPQAGVRKTQEAQDKRIGALERTVEGGASVGIYTAANQAEQLALAAALAPTPQRPLFVMREDMRGRFDPGPVRFTMDGGFWQGLRTQPLEAEWLTVPLSGGWTNYEAGYRPFGFLRLGSGIVALQGLVKGGANGLLFTLPPGYRPSARRALYAICSRNNLEAARVDIYPDGRVILSSADSGWTSLDGLVFPVDGAVTWTPLTLLNGFTYDANWGVPSIGTDVEGRVWFQGALSRSTPIPGGQDQPIAAIPANLAPAAQFHFGTVGGMATGNVGGGLDVTTPGPAPQALPGSASLRAKTNLNVNGFTLCSVMYTPANVEKYQGMAYVSPWVDYGDPFPGARVMRHRDGLVTMSGLVRGGTVGTASNAIPEYFRNRGGRALFPTAAGNAPGRTDMAGDTLYQWSGQTTWRSLDGIYYVMEA